MSQYEMFLATSLEKVFPHVRPKEMKKGTPLSVWRGAKAAVQLVYYKKEEDREGLRKRFHVSIENSPCDVKIRGVELLPSDFTCFEGVDDDYLTKEAGLFPDLLKPLSNGIFRPLPNQYRSLWLTFDVKETDKTGDHIIKITVEDTGEGSTGERFETFFTLRIGKKILPEQTLIHTEWFHGDCLADYYKTDVFSEEHWEILEKFIFAAGREHGVNMLLTPVFTQPLDTAVGGERTTIQLVDVYLEKGEYRFDFDKLEHWTSLCQEAGIKYLEIAHFFTQWGAKFTPKIMAFVDGEYRKIFGWEVPAESEEYRKFLYAFIPRLQAALEKFGYDKEHVYYHISDEPTKENPESYKKAKEIVAPLLQGCHVIDALSDLEFYQNGLVDHPIPSTDHIEPFYEAKVPNLWVYYCCCQGNLVPNRFFSMASYRNRIMGVLFYLYDLKGFLHWGYNFYNSQYSLRGLNPYCVTHADYGFPSGDSYLVYPGENGEALSSIRAEVQDEALCDLRSLQLLESLTNRQHVEELIFRCSDMKKITFTDYPRNAEFLLSLREEVAKELEK